jgi:hypothetical protein
VFCADASTGILTDHPYLKDEQLADIEGKKGYPLGKEILRNATYGQVKRLNLLVAAPWLRQTAREGDLPYEGRRSEVRGGQLQRMTMSVGALSRETNSLRDDDSRTCSWGRESFIRARHASSAAHTRAVPDHRPARIGEVSRGAPMDGRGGRMSQNHRQYRVPDARHLGVRVALGRSVLQSLSGIE